MHDPTTSAVAVPVSARLAIASIAGFWAVWLALVTGRALVMGWPDQGGMLVRRIGMAMIGVVLAWCIHLLLRSMVSVRMPIRAATAFLACAPAAMLFAGLNSYLFYRWLPVPSVLPDFARWEDGAVLRTAIADGFVTWYFFFAAWAAFLLALGVVGEVRAVERQRGAAEAAAHDAHLAMLRVQVDPHFLFNALNALAAMVAGGEAKAAGRNDPQLGGVLPGGAGREPRRRHFRLPTRWRSSGSILPSSKPGSATGCPSKSTCPHRCTASCCRRLFFSRWSRTRSSMA